MQRNAKNPDVYPIPNVIPLSERSFHMLSNKKNPDYTYYNRSDVNPVDHKKHTLVNTFHKGTDVNIVPIVNPLSVRRFPKKKNILKTIGKKIKQTFTKKDHNHNLTTLGNYARHHDSVKTRSRFEIANKTHTIKNHRDTNTRHIGYTPPHSLSGSKGGRRGKSSCKNRKTVKKVFGWW
jgi:hypothetical protein